MKKAFLILTAFCIALIESKRKRIFKLLNNKINLKVCIKVVLYGYLHFENKIAIC